MSNRKPQYSADVMALNADVIPEIEAAQHADDRSQYEIEFEGQIKLYQIDQFIEAQLQFDPEREFRFDFGNRDRKIGIEIDGGNRMAVISKRTGKPVAIGRHTQAADYRKLNLATAQGWQVYRFTPDMVKSGEAIEFVMSVLLPF